MPGGDLWSMVLQEPSIHIEKCLDYYLTRHFEAGRTVRAAALGDCPYDALLARHGRLARLPSGEGRADLSAPRGLFEIVYLGGGHAFLDLAVAIRRAIAVLAPDGILVLPNLDAATTRFCFDLLDSSDDFFLHFTMERTAFFGRQPTPRPVPADWTEENLNRQRYPAFDPEAYVIPLNLPVRLVYDGVSARCPGELEHGFIARAGRIFSEGHDSRIRLRVKPGRGSGGEAGAGAGEVEVGLTLRPVAPVGVQPPEVTVQVGGGAPARHLLAGAGAATVTLTARPSDDGVVEIVLRYAHLHPASACPQPGVTFPPHARLAVELVSVSLHEPGNQETAPGLGRYAGEICTFHHRGQPFRFFVDDPHDSIQAHHCAGEFYETEELELIGRHLPPGSRILDVGANIGNHAVYFEKVLGAARIVAIELQPRVIAVLRMNVLLNGLTRTDLSRLGTGFGAAAHRATMAVPQAFNVAGAQFSADAGGDFEIRPGDAIVSDEAFDFIKIDVEGMECDVIDGLATTIARCQPLLFVEVWNGNLPRFNAQLQAMGYAVREEWRRYDVAVNLLAGPAGRE